MTRQGLWVGVLTVLVILPGSWAADAPAVVEACDAGATAAAAPPEEGSPTLDAVWSINPGKGVSSGRVQLKMKAPEETPAAEPVAFLCEIESVSNFDKARGVMTITDSQGNQVSRGEIPIQVLKGSNTCKYQWVASGAAPGEYRAYFELDYTNEDAPVTYTLMLKRVTDGQLKSDLARLKERFAGIRKQVDAINDPAKLPYVRVRLAVAELFAGRAEQDIAKGAWRAVDGVACYLEKTAQATEAAIAFEGLTPETAESAPAADLSALEIADGAVLSGGRPVYLFGRVLTETSAAAVEQLHTLGLNLAVMNVPPSAVLAGESETAAFQAAFDPALDQAAASNVSVVAQLAPDALGEWVFDKWPDIKDHGFVDLTHPGVHETFLRHINAVIPYLAERKMVGAVCLTQGAQFRYDTEEVRQAFLEYVRQRYPDRQTLNQVWHAHLANYEEITIWDDKAPEWSYQNRRAYQYDWQTFHRHLIQGYFDEVNAAIKALAPSMRLTAMAADTAFELAETRMTPNREELAQALDITGCSSVAASEDKYYAMCYPNTAAFYTLTKSFAPSKPIYNLDSRFVFDAALDAPHAFAFVNTAVWEAVINGVNAMALGPDSPVFDRPETAEAFVTAALDVNRLAPMVHALQQVPPAIGILFSDASKIFEDGVPHLKSARYAYEGCSFAGYSVRFLTESQIKEGILDDIKILVIPQTPAVSEDTFKAVMAYTKKGGAVARVGSPIPYDEWGQSRRDVVQNTGNTVLVRGMNLPTEYLHAMDAAIVLGQLPSIPRPINASGYPVEGVKTRYAEVDGEPYLYAINLRKTKVNCHLAGGMQSGRDLIRGRDVSFPRVLEPLDPMLIHLDKVNYEKELEAAPEKAGGK